MNRKTKPATARSFHLSRSLFFLDAFMLRRWAGALLTAALGATWLAVIRTPAPAAGPQPSRAVVKAGGIRSEADELAAAAEIVGPDGNADNACSKCHILETEAWQNTHHFSAFNERHQSRRAKDILAAMKLKSMKRQGQCRECHYTSTLDSGKITPTWGVSCESCHGPAADWVGLHNRPGADPAAKALVWGTGKSQSPAAREKRMTAAQARGMINSRMIYDLAINCFGCHSVPDETLVNQGGHEAGSDFDLVAWSQGEVRHNFVDSAGAPDHPANRLDSPAQLRRLYVVGAFVDLQFSLRNVANVKQKGGAFDKAMIDRVNSARAKAAAILARVSIPELADALNAVPEKVDSTTVIPASLPETLGAATRSFTEKDDGSKLGAIDPLIPTKYMGNAYKEAHP